MIKIIKLTDEQKQIVECCGNIVVSANAGTGKTATLIEKINFENSSNNTYKMIGAITFTIKATNEIKERLTAKTEKVYVNTNNGFVFDEIITPFYKDCNRECNIEAYTTDYNQKFESYNDGIRLLLNKGIIGSYKNPKLNFIFELANYILDNSIACQKYLKSKYKLICIDEYQDTDDEMHKLFMKLKNILEINLFIIGDTKQSIYIWRNSKPELFENVIHDTEFNYFKLTKNFRSTKSIQNYSNILLAETQSLVDFNNIDRQDVSIIMSSSETENLITALNKCDKSKPFALLRFSRTNASNDAKIINDYGIECNYIPLIPIREITTNSSWLYIGLSEYLIKPAFSEYDFFQQIPGGIDNNEELKYIKMMLKKIKKLYVDNDKKSLFNEIKKLGIYYDYNISEEHFELFYQSITQDEYIKAIKIDMNKTNISLTFHTSKGLQFEQVIINAADYPLNNIESVYNHYVASTRAKSKLIILLNTQNYNCRQFAMNINERAKSVNASANEIFNIIKKET